MRVSVYQSALVCFVSLFLVWGVSCSPPAQPCDSVTCPTGFRCYEGSCKIHCDSGKTACGVICVDLQQSPLHCGACGSFCSLMEVCKNGTCVVDCPKQQSLCNGFCVNTLSDSQHCGACGVACTSGQTCVQGSCSLACPRGQSDCGGQCVNKQTDSSHCGYCDVACSKGDTCVQGRCELKCPAGQTACGKICVDLQKDNNHCGVCETTCKSPASCVKGFCRIVCPTGQSVCGQQCVDLQTNKKHCGSCDNVCPQGGSCSKSNCRCPNNGRSCNGVCKDTQNDAKHCGDCDKACATGQQCQAGICVTPQQCSEGFTFCRDRCVNLKKDARNCGRCNQFCSSPQTCQSGKCKCPKPGYGYCSNACVDLQSNRNHCGTCNKACSLALSCVAGACRCPSGMTICVGSCKDLSTDNDNCGGCNKQCKAGKSCRAGICQCPSGQTVCAGVCVDLQSDRSHCGACNKVCSPRKQCTSGVCACPTGQAVCLGQCTDFQTNPKHCGGCGKACAAGFVCRSGSCQCPTGQSSCSGRCVDQQKDPNHCGSCAKQCPSGQACVSGSCSTTCPSGETLCKNVCVDLSLSAQHCGSCNKACQPGMNCTSGTCRIPLDFVPYAHNFDVAVDGQGNTFVAGYFTLSPTLEFGSLLLFRKGLADVFIAKMDSKGRWLWAKSADASYQQYAYSLALDANSNVYLTGNFQNRAVFGNTTLQSKGSGDVFVAKLDKDGKWLWAASGGGPADDSGTSIAVDAQGNAYVTGHVGYNTTFVSGANTFSLQGGGGIFVAKINPSGQWLWVQSAGGKGRDNGQGIAVDRFSHIYLTGTFQSTAVFGTHTLKAKKSTDVFVARLDTQGKWLWAVRGGGSNSIGGTKTNIAVSPAGYPYITGTIKGSPVTYGSTTLKASHYDVLVAKLDPSGTWLWAKLAGGVGPDEGIGIDVDRSGNVYVHGFFHKAATFGNLSLSTAGGFDIFLGKLDEAGNWLWVEHAGGGAKTDMGRGVAIGPDGQLHVIGGVYHASSSSNVVVYGHKFVGAVGQHSYLARRVPKQACPTSCSSGTTCCMGACVKLTSSAHNCGACGKSCGPKESCNSSSCTCQTGTTRCGKNCVDTQTSNAHCGACNNACASGKRCQSGSCQ